MIKSWLEWLKFWKWDWKLPTLTGKSVSVSLAEVIEDDPEKLDQLQLDLNEVPDEKKELYRSVNEKIKSEAALNNARAEHELREAQRASQQAKTAALVAKREQKRLDNELEARMKRTNRKVRLVRRTKFFRNLNENFFGSFQFIGSAVSRNYKLVGFISFSVAVIALAYYFAGEFWSLIAFLVAIFCWTAFKVPAKEWAALSNGFVGLAGSIKDFVVANRKPVMYIIGAAILIVGIYYAYLLISFWVIWNSIASFFGSIFSAIGNFLSGIFWAVYGFVAVFWDTILIVLSVAMAIYFCFKFRAGLKRLWNKVPKRLNRQKLKDTYRMKLKPFFRNVKAFVVKFIRKIGAVACSLLFVFGLINDEHSIFYRAMWTLGFVLFWWFIDLGFIGKPMRLFSTIVFGGLWITSVLMYFTR